MTLRIRKVLIRMVFRGSVIVLMTQHALKLNHLSPHMQSEIEAKRDNLNKLSYIILGAALTVHKEMGPGLLESIYQLCMVKELRSRGIRIGQSVHVPLCYKGEPLDKDYVIDLLVENEIIVELKAIDGILPVHEAQILSYLKLANKKLGFLINFNVPVIKTGFKRYVNGF